MLFDNKFGSTGPHMDVCAPANNVFSTVPGPLIIPSYGTLSGTSMAAPHVTGLASLMLSLNPDLYNDDVEWLLRRSARDLGAPGFDNTFGAGLVSADGVLEMMASPYILEHGTASGGTTHLVSSRYRHDFYNGSGPTIYPVSCKRYEIRKSITFSNTFAEIPQVWGRGVACAGYNTSNPNFGMGYCEAVPGTITTTGCVLRTYVYGDFLFLVTGLPLSGNPYVPTAPAFVEFAYTAHGRGSLTSGVPGDREVGTQLKVTPVNNPSHGGAVFAVSIARSGSGTLRVFDPSGRLISKVYEGPLEKGDSEFRWDGLTISGRRANPGVYFYHMRSQDATSRGRIVLLQ